MGHPHGPEHDRNGSSKQFSASIVANRDSAVPPRSSHRLGLGTPHAPTRVTRVGRRAEFDEAYTVTEVRPWATIFIALADSGALWLPLAR
jgi:hypothetical protein